MYFQITRWFQGNFRQTRMKSTDVRFEVLKVSIILVFREEDIFVHSKSHLGLNRWHSCSGWGGLGLQSDVDRFKATRTAGDLNISSKSLHFRSQHQSRFGSLPSFQLWIKPTVGLISFIGEKHSSDFFEKHCANTFAFWCFDISSEERSGAKLYIVYKRYEEIAQS